MTETDNIIIDTTARIFSELGDPQTLNNASEDNCRQLLWTALENSGLYRAWVPEGQGGAGAEIIDGFDILVIAGCFAVVLPLAETLLAGWLLAKVRIMMPNGPLSVAMGNADNSLRINTDGNLFCTAQLVSFVDIVDHFVVFTGK
jgi:acyl-CoA dehydrogenase